MPRAVKETAPDGMTRIEADKAGYGFFLGSECKRGHNGRRYAVNGECVECCVARALKKQKNDPQYARDRNKRYSERHPEKAAVRVKRWLQNPANLEKKREGTRRWQNANPDKVKEACSNYYYANLEEQRARVRNYMREHPEKAREICRRRRSRLKEAVGSHTIDEIMALLDVQGGLCVGPGCNADIMDCWTIDHKIPLVREGSDDIGNLQLLCKPCNSSKNDRTMEEWKDRRTNLGRGKIDASRQMEAAP